MDGLYVRPEGRKSITIPDNYGGNAFSERARISPPEPVAIEPISDEPEAQPETVEVAKAEEKKRALFSGIGSEELLLLGMILILSQSDEGSDILPFLLILLFFKGGK